MIVFVNRRVRGSCPSVPIIVTVSSGWCCQTDFSLLRDFQSLFAGLVTHISCCVSRTGIHQMIYFMQKCFICLSAYSATVFELEWLNCLPFTPLINPFVLSMKLKQVLQIDLLVYFCFLYITDMSTKLSDLEHKSQQWSPFSDSSSPTTEEVIQNLLAISNLLTRWKLQLRQLQHGFCLELSLLRSVHKRYSAGAPNWIDSWTSHLMDAYYNLVQRSALLNSCLKQHWLWIAFDEWIRCAGPYTDRIRLALQ